MKFAPQLRISSLSVVVIGLALAGCSAEKPVGESHRQISEKAEETASQQSRMQPAIDADKEDLWTRPGSDWTTFLGKNRDGKSDESHLLFPWPDDLAPIWTHRIGEGYGSGSISHGRYYHFDRVGDQARLVCLNAETGKPLWQFQYPTDYVDMYGFDGGPRSSPVIDDGRVYVFGVEGMLHCLDAHSGQLIWKIDTTERFGVKQNFFGVGSTPLIYKDLLIAMIGGSPESSQSVPKNRLDLVEPDNSAIVALDKRDGSVKYKTGNDLASYASPVVTTIQEKTVGLGFCRENLLCFDPDNGDIHWKFRWRARKYESVNASTPVVWDDRILITESYAIGGTLLRIDDDGPHSVWTDRGKREQSIACHWCTPIVIDGYAYLSSGEKSGEAELRCVELATGTVKWLVPRLSRASLLLVDDHLVCLTEQGRLFCFQPDPEQFTKVSEYQSTESRLVGPCWAAPILAHGYLYVRDRSKVLCFDLRP